MRDKGGAQRERLRRWVPRWWAGEGGIAGQVLNALLWPAEQAFRAGAALRNGAYDRAWLASTRAPIPVISVGNIGVGGAGKTPFAAWLAGCLQEWGYRPAVVLRGYGGDEVLVHRDLNPDVPVFAGRERARVVAAAAEQGAGAAVLDDAFQHRALARDLDLVLVPVEGWHQQRRLLPRGPWREPASSLRRADLIVLTRKAATEAEAREAWQDVARAARGRPLVECVIAPSVVEPLHAGSSGDLGLSSFVGQPVLAVAALADPAPFAANLAAAGADAELASFPDHHAFSADEARRLAERASGRPLLMTLKDAVKLRALLPRSLPAFVVRQEVRIGRGAELLEAALRAAVEGSRG